MIASLKWTVLLWLVTPVVLVSAAQRELPPLGPSTIGMRATEDHASPSLAGRLPAANPLATSSVSGGATAQVLAGHGNPLWAISLVSLSATRERPIFSPSRRPPPIAELPQIQSPPTPAVVQQSGPLLTLVGAIAGDGEGIAIFVDQTTKGAVRLKTGESHLGWLLQVIKRRQVTLQKNSETAILYLPNSLGE
jgi:hypothetical protein